MTRRIVPVLVLLAALGSQRVEAQLQVTDPANIARQSITASIKESILEVSAKTNQVLTVMAKRLHQLHELREYAISRVAGWLDMPFSYLRVPLELTNGFMRTLQTGEAVVDSVRQFDIDPRRLDQGPLESALTSLDLAGSVLSSGMEAAGRIRGNGASEASAIGRLERDVTGRGSGSATEALDTLTGAALIRARQHEDRTKLATVMVETLLVENTRERQTEASAMRMRMGLLEHHHGRSDDPAQGQSWANDLQTWRQP